MSPSISEARGRGGFSLLEVLVALAASGLLLWGLTRFYKDSTKAYDLQSQIQERDQNAHFTVKWLTEALQQAGASLPDTGYAILTASGGTPASTIVLGSNPRGGIYFVSSPGPGSLTKAPVGDTAQFTKAAYALVDYVDPARGIVKRRIAGKKKGASGAADTLLLSSSLPFPLSVGDVIYAYNEQTVALSGGNLTVDGLVFAENIDSLQFLFYDSSRTATTAWARMRSATIKVTARTPHPDPALAGDGYRRISISMNIFLRSRV
jgi:prepilin-type N-terminal cleavage/methylation domain-containing protein